MKDVTSLTMRLHRPLTGRHRLKGYSGRSRSGSPAVTGRRSGAVKQRRTGAGDSWRHQAAGDAGAVVLTVAFGMRLCWGLKPAK